MSWRWKKSAMKTIISRAKCWQPQKSVCGLVYWFLCRKSDILMSGNVRDEPFNKIFLFHRKFIDIVVVLLLLLWLLQVLMLFFFFLWRKTDCKTVTLWCSIDLDSEHTNTKTLSTLNDYYWYYVSNWFSHFKITNDIINMQKKTKSKLQLIVQRAKFAFCG